MAYWRMQLHPNEPGDSVHHAVTSLTAGYIGLDFANEIGDLTTADRATISSPQKDYVLFCTEMAEGDRVLVVAHQYPLALASVAGPYNFIRHRVPELGLWFRHFRPVSDVWWYSDYITNPRAWEQTTMTDTISPLRDPTTISYRLIDRWIASVQRAAGA